MALSNVFLESELGDCVQHFSLALFSHGRTCIPGMKRAVSEGTGPEAQGNISERQLAVTQHSATTAVRPSPEQEKGAGFGRVRQMGRRGRKAVEKNKNKSRTIECRVA